jgi:AcrR family transcriptional regulator
MGHKHSREQILDGALQVAIDQGLSVLTFGRVAKHLGISDRTVVYYFPSKDDLVSDVSFTIGGQVQAVLAEAFTAPAAGHLDLCRAAWPVLARPDIDPLFSLFFEANGLAAAGREPYAALVRQLVEAWVAWVAEFFDGPARQRRAEAEAAIALIDGLLLLRQLSGAAAANRAATQLGVR